LFYFDIFKHFVKWQLHLYLVGQMHNIVCH